jgi:integrase
MPGKQAKVVTPPMLKRMLRHVSHSSFPARDRAMILLSVKAGLRACEIAGLDWSMVLDAQGHVSGIQHGDPRSDLGCGVVGPEVQCASA